MDEHGVIADQDRPEGVVAVIACEGRWLMIRRAEGIKAAGWWCFPGGGIEPGEDPRAALVREIREEVGLDIEVGRQVWQWERPDGGLKLGWWQAWLTKSDQELRCNPAEVAEARWVAPSHLSRLAPVLENNLLFCRIYLAGQLPLDE